MSTISILFEQQIESSTLGLLTPGINTIVKEVDVAKIKHALADLSGKISGMLQDIKAVGDFKLKEVELSVQISAEGGVALIGTAKTGVQGAITLKFSV